MDADKLTSLSAGSVIRELLLADDDVKERVNKIYPITTDDSTLPYLVYRRAGMNVVATKAPTVPVADTVQFEILCYTDNYAQGIELAECVRAALECKQYKAENGLYARTILLTDAEEGWENDAYVQQLTFTIKI